MVHVVSARLLLLFLSLPDFVANPRSERGLAAVLSEGPESGDFDSALPWLTWP